MIPSDAFDGIERIYFHICKRSDGSEVMATVEIQTVYPQLCLETW